MQDGTQSQLYERSDEAFHFFNRVADQVLRSFAPARVLVVGPAVGLLVEALWDRGVEAEAECLDATTVDRVRIDVKGFCSVGLDSRPSQEFDVVICIDFLKWSKLHDLDANVASLARRAGSILFLSLADEAGDGQPELPLLDWIERLGQLGLAPRTTFDLTFASANTLLVERNRERLTQEHAVDFVRMRKVMNSSRLMERQVHATQQRLNTSQEDLTALQERLHATESKRADAVRQLALSRSDEQLIRRRLEQAISIINSTNVNPSVPSSELAKLRHELELARHDLQMVYWSSSWRVTRPLRVLGTLSPGFASGARKLAKLLYWTLTLQLPKRLKARREFRRSAGLSS